MSDAGYSYLPLVLRAHHDRAPPQDDCGLGRIFRWKRNDHRRECQRRDLGYCEEGRHRITFWQFFKFGFPVMVSSVALSALYLWLVFLR